MWSAIDIEKSTNGEDADAAPGPSILVGDPVDWEYVVTSDENVSNVVVSDNPAATISGPSGDDGDGILEPDETWVYTASDTASFGQYENEATVTGDGETTGAEVTDSDLSHYLGLYEACSKGFWQHHPAEWPDYDGDSPDDDTDDLVDGVFTDPGDIINDTDTLMDALKYKGNGGKPDDLKRGAQRLLRQAVAAVLNAAAGFSQLPEEYDTVAEVITAVDTALAGTAEDMLDLAEMLDSINSGICPLGEEEEEEEPELAPRRHNTISTLWGSIKTQ